MMQISSMPESIASSPMIWMTGLVSPSRSTSGNISFCTAVDAGYCRVPRPAAVMTALRTLAMGSEFSDWRDYCAIHSRRVAASARS